MNNGNERIVPQGGIPVDKKHYLSLMGRYNKAEEAKEAEFDWVTPEGQTLRLVTKYAYYMLEFMANRLGVPMKGGKK